MINKAENIQDTIRPRILPVTDTFKFGKLKVFTFQDSLRKIPERADSLRERKITRKILPVKPVDIDTTTVCERNPIADISLSDSTSFIWSLDLSIPGKFPEHFILTSSEWERGKKEALYASLKEGENIKTRQFAGDWVVPVLLITAALFALVRTTSGDAFKNLIRFFSFRSFNEPSSRLTVDLFQWHSTLVNLASFISISLFGWLLAVHNGISIGGLPGFVIWLICLGIVISGITLRHFITVATGDISNEKELFSEYIVSIYQAYRIAGISLLIISSLILYTYFMPVNLLFRAGIYVTALLYIMRVFKLFLIFINRNVTILYLILYLCALEILPVAVLIKYVTGLF